MRLIVTAGGTGGHIFPAIAIARALGEKTDAQILFVGTDRGMEEKLARQYNLDFKALQAMGIKGKGIGNLSKALQVNIRAFRQACKIVKEFNPDWVIGTGGYVTGMVVLAGRLAGARCAIQEQNSIPGLTNRILGRLSQRIFLSYPDTSHAFNAKKTILSGNPLRKDFTTAKKEKPSSLVIVGGSLGAHSINVAAVKAVELIKDKLDGLHIIHQTGQTDYEWVCQQYSEAGLNIDVRAFIENMPEVLSSACLSVTRAGGITLSELSSLGVPAIMIPLPHAADNHQYFNAKHVSDAGGGWILPDGELSPENLGAMIAVRLHDRQEMQKATDAMRNLKLGEGAGRIAQEILTCSKV